MSDFETELVRTQQGELADRGFYTGYLDGVYGPLTSSAMTDFKKACGLRARDYPGPVTMRHLWDPSNGVTKPDPDAKEGEPPWLAEARRLIGVEETPGPDSTPSIMKWAADLDQWYPDDSTPWCGLFVAHCMAVGAPEEPQNFNRLGAREWSKYGEKSNLFVGCIGVFWRKSPSDWRGHVGFIVGEDALCYYVLGGNQSDAVNVTRISRERLLSSRSPKGRDVFWGQNLPWYENTRAATSHNEQ